MTISREKCSEWVKESETPRLEPIFKNGYYTIDLEEMEASLTTPNVKDTPLKVIETLNERLKAYSEREHVLMHEVVRLEKENDRLKDTVDAISLDLWLIK